MQKLTLLAGIVVLAASSNALANTHNAATYCDADNFTVSVQSPRMSVVSQPFQSGKEIYYSIPKVKQGTLDMNSYVTLCGAGIQNCTFRHGDGDATMGVLIFSNQCIRINVITPYNKQNISEFTLHIEPAIGKWGKSEFGQFIIDQH